MKSINCPIFGADGTENFEILHDFTVPKAPKQFHGQFFENFVNKKDNEIWVYGVFDQRST